MKRFLYYVSVLALCISCSQDVKKKPRAGTKKKDEHVKDGITRLYYSDGKLRAEISMKGGLRNGLATDYYTNGQKHLVINYVNNKNEGLVTKYYDNGRVDEETMYKDGKMHGLKKSYRKDGSLSAEVTYHNGLPCAGLKEYSPDGKLRKDLPKIVVEGIDKMLTENKYILRLRMSDNSTNVTFYRGKLTGGCLDDNNVREIYRGKTKGVAELDFYIGPGMFVMEEIPLIAKVKTPRGNYYVTQINHNLAIEYR